MKKIILLSIVTLSLLKGFAQKHVGIGTTNPLAALHVADSSVLFTGPATFPVTDNPSLDALVPVSALLPVSVIVPTLPVTWTCCTVTFVSVNAVSKLVVLVIVSTKAIPPGAADTDNAAPFTFFAVL